MSRSGPGVTMGDRTERWSSSYRAVRKDPLRSTVATNRRRLTRLHAPELVGKEGRWIDLGAGDGNLLGSLAAIGVRSTVAVEPQLDLLALHPAGGQSIAGSAIALPLRDAAATVVVAMDVLHHLPPDDIAPALVEVRRVLVAGGGFLVCEPANSITRRALMALITSPLGSVTRFSRHKRTMVEEEAATLEPWLATERNFDARLEAAGFEVVGRHRGPLHAYWRARRR